MGIDKMMAKFKLLDAAMRIVANDVSRNVRSPGAHDDAEDEYAEEMLVVAASDFIDAWREPRTPGKEQRTLENIEDLVSRGGATVGDEPYERLTRIKNVVAMRIAEIKGEQAADPAAKQMLINDFLKELALAFEPDGKGYESEAAALFAMETRQRIEKSTADRIATKLERDGFSVAAEYIRNTMIEG